MAFPSGYVLQEAQEAITLSAIAYQGEDSDYNTIRSAITTALGSSSVLGGHFALIWLGISPDGANLLYLAKDNRATSRYALVSRGTDWNFLTDWVDDFDVLDTHNWPTANPPDPSILVGQGPWDGLQALLTMKSHPEETTLGAVLTQISTQAAAALDLLVTGHSLGGAARDHFGALSG